MLNLRLELSLSDAVACLRISYIINERGEQLDYSFRYWKIEEPIVVSLDHGAFIIVSDRLFV